MALVTPTEALKLVKRSKAALYKDVKTGKVSATKGEDGKTLFDTSELARVYGSLKNPSEKSAADIQKNTVEDEQRLGAMQREITLLRELMQEKDAHIATLKDSLRLLEYRQQTESQAVQSETKKGFFERFLK